VHSAESEHELFVALAKECDWTLVIAPELDGILNERHAWIAPLTPKLLSPAGEFLKIASSKRATAERLTRHKVPAPRAAQEPYEFPLVFKRDDGAGSLGMRLILAPDELPRSLGTNCRLESYCRGMATSVAVLCGSEGNVPLQPCEQILQPEMFEYLGGRTPIPSALARRAQSLALAAIGAMPPTIGYVGVDLVLGGKDDGTEDVVIEINPRLTTSYVGLRLACRQNLAQAMLDVARGSAVDLCFGEERVEFRADGKVTAVTQDCQVLPGRLDLLGR
jgi:predicted ATP-grasp superfamily ATP-dependent carboligase